MSCCLEKGQLLTQVKNLEKQLEAERVRHESLSRRLRERDIERGRLETELAGCQATLRTEQADSQSLRKRAEAAESLANSRYRQLKDMAAERDSYMKSGDTYRDAMMRFAAERDEAHRKVADLEERAASDAETIKWVRAEQQQTLASLVRASRNRDEVQSRLDEALAKLAEFEAFMVKVQEPQDSENPVVWVPGPNGANVPVTFNIRRSDGSRIPFRITVNPDIGAGALVVLEPEEPMPKHLCCPVGSGEDFAGVRQQLEDELRKSEGIRDSLQEQFQARCAVWEEDERYLRERIKDLEKQLSETLTPSPPVIMLNCPSGPIDHKSAMKVIRKVAKDISDLSNRHI